MNKFFAYSLALFVAVLAVDVSNNSGIAQTPDNPTWYDTSCFGYCYLDASKIKIEKLAAVITDLAGESSRLAASIGVFEKELSDWQQKLIATNANDIYIVFSLDDLTRPRGVPFVFVGARDSSQHEMIAQGVKQLVQVDGLAGHSVDGGVVVCDKITWKRISGARLPIRTDASRSLDLAQGHELAVVINPSPEQQKVFRETAPEFPPPFALFNGQLTVEGAHAVVVSVDSKDAVKVRLEINGTTRESSLELYSAMKDLLAQLRDRELPLPKEPAEVVVELSSKINLHQSGQTITTGVVVDDPDFTALKRKIAAWFAYLERGYYVVQQQNKLRELTIALHNYHDAYKSFPAYASTDDEGKPLLSWRVQILSFIDRKLYSQFKLDEPWDSPHNRKLIEQMPAVYNSNDELAKSGKTTIMMPMGDDFIGGPVGQKLHEIVDGTSRTIVLVNVTDDLAVPWTQPADWEVDLSNPLNQLRRDESGNIQAALADANVHIIEIDQEKLQALLTIDGGENVSVDE